MQNSLWKLVTAAGIVAIGTLVVLEVQNQLAGGVAVADPEAGPAGEGPPSETASSEPVPEGLMGEVQMSPDPTTEFDLLFQDLSDPGSDAPGGNAAGRVESNTVVAHHSGQSAADVNTQVSRDNLGGNQSPFAAFDEPAEILTAAATATPGSQSLQPASHQQEAQPFRDESDASSHDSVPVFNLADAPGMTQMAAPRDPQPEDSTPFFQDDSPAAAAAPSPDGGEVVDFGTGNFFADEPAAPTAASQPRSGGQLQPELQTPEPAAEPADANIFVPFAFDEPASGNADDDQLPPPSEGNQRDPVEWPGMGNPLQLPEPAPSNSLPDSEAVPATADPDPFNADADPEFFPLDTITPETGESGGAFFTEDEASDSVPIPDLDFDRRNNTPSFERDGDDVFNDRRFDAISNSRDITNEGLSVPVRDPSMDRDQQPLQPVAPTPLDSNDFPPLNLTPRESDSGFDRLPGQFSDDPEPAIDSGSAGHLPGLPGTTDILPTSGTMSSVMRPHLTIEKDAPETATVGVPLEYMIIVRNEGQSIATDVIVEDALPAAADLETAHPVPDYDRESRRLRWQLQQLGPGDTETISVRIVPNGEGTLDGVATVRFKAFVKSTTRITSPKLRLSMDGPSQVRLGDTVPFTFVVTNEGTGDAVNVVLRNILPPGLQHPEGNDLEYEISSLASGERQEVTLDVVAAEPGEFKNAAEVTSAGIAADSASAPIMIVGAQLTVERLGPQRRYVGRRAQFQNIITNDTVFDASNAVVVERVPEGFRFVSAGNNGEYNPAERLITWRLPRIPSGEQVLLDVELAAERPGELDTIVEVVEEAGFRTRATRTVAIEDIHNLSADISRLEGPIAVGEKFGFSIVVDNRGTAVARNVQLNVQVPQQIKVLAAGSNEMSASRTAENVVHYATVLEIEPDQKAVFRLSLQGDVPVQNALVKAHLKYDDMDQPLVVSESVTVYSDSL